MVFQKNPKWYRRISQTLAIITIVGVLHCGVNLIKKKYDSAKHYAPLATLAGALSGLSYLRFKSLENKINNQEDK